MLNESLAGDRVFNARPLPKKTLAIHIVTRKAKNADAIASVQKTSVPEIHNGNECEHRRNQTKERILKSPNKSLPPEHSFF